MLRINHTKCSLLYDVSKCNLFQAYRSSSNSRNKCACVMMVAGEQDYIRERKTGPRRTLVLSYVHVFCQNPSAWQESQTRQKSLTRTIKICTYSFPCLFGRLLVFYTYVGASFFVFFPFPPFFFLSCAPDVSSFGVAVPQLSSLL